MIQREYLCSCIETFVLGCIDVTSFHICKVMLEIEMALSGKQIGIMPATAIKVF